MLCDVISNWERRLGFRRCLALTVLVSLFQAGDASAVVFKGTGDPEHNTMAPDGDLSGSGWQFLGTWGGGAFVGTALGPHHFITARHLGGHVGQAFRYRGEDYIARALYEFGPNDLRIWEVCQTIPGPYPPLYLEQDELGKPLVVFGRGRARGEAVSLETPDGPEHRGWKVGTADRRLRWGENEVSEIVDYSEFYDTAEPGELQFLYSDFSRDGDFNEAHLSTGDSGGAVFIQSNGTWSLAGVVFGAFGRFNTEPEPPGFIATLFDGGGFHLRQMEGDPVPRPRNTTLGCDNLFPRPGQEFVWNLLEDVDEDVANGFFATRISNYADWIQDVLAGRVEPCYEGPWVVSASSLDGAYSFDRNQSHDTESQTIRIPIAEGARFFRLTGCEAHEVTQWSFSDDFVTLDYQKK